MEQLKTLCVIDCKSIEITSSLDSCTAIAAFSNNSNSGYQLNHIIIIFLTQKTKSKYYIVCIFSNVLFYGGYIRTKLKQIKNISKTIRMDVLELFLSFQNCMTNFKYLDYLFYVFFF